MSLSLQGVLVDGAELSSWHPDDAELALLREKLRSDAELHSSGPDLDAFLDEVDRALVFVGDRGEHPGRTWEGAHVTWTILRGLGQPVHSNAFNPIGWNAIKQMDASVRAAGSPVGLLESKPVGGPWGLADGDATFFGGWDRPTLRTVSAAIHQAENSEAEMPLRELGRWVDSALTQNLTLWAWIA